MPRGWLRVLAGVVMFVVLADSTFVGYFGSPFVDTAGIVGTLVMVPSAVWLYARGENPWQRSCSLVLFTAGAALLVSTKVQTTTAAIPLCLFLLWQAVRTWPGRRRIGRLLWKLVPLACLAGVVFPTVSTWQRNPTEFRVINPTEVIFGSILGLSSHPQADAVALGLPEKFAKYSGRDWWAKGKSGPEYDPDFAKIQSKMSYATVAHFLSRHPGRAITIADVRATDFLRARPDYLGSYQAGHAAPAKLECRVCLASTVMSGQARLGLFGLVFTVLAAAAAAIGAIRNSRANTARRGFAVLSLLFNAITVVQFFTAAYGEAIETTKHLAIAVLTAMLSGLCALAAYVADHGQPAAEELAAEELAAEELAAEEPADALSPARP